MGDLETFARLSNEARERELALEFSLQDDLATLERLYARLNAQGHTTSAAHVWPSLHAAKNLAIARDLRE